MQTKLIIRLGLAALVILFLAIMQYRARTIGKKNFAKFYGSTVEGKVEQIGRSTGFVYLTVNGARYSFMPSPVDQVDNTPFFDRVEKNDSIIKPRLSDTLHLIKGGKHFLYTFKKLTD